MLQGYLMKVTPLPLSSTETWQAVIAVDPFKALEPCLGVILERKSAITTWPSKLKVTAATVYMAKWDMCFNNNTWSCINGPYKLFNTHKVPEHQFKEKWQKTENKVLKHFQWLVALFLLVAVFPQGRRTKIVFLVLQTEKKLKGLCNTILTVYQEWMQLQQICAKPLTDKKYFFNEALIFFPNQPSYKTISHSMPCYYILIYFPHENIYQQNMDFIFKIRPWQHRVPHFFRHPFTDI